MNTFAIETLGCKVNQYETQQIRQTLENFGLKMVKTADSPDIVVINTCCVTKTAAAKSRQAVRKARRLNPDSTIILTGCLAELDSKTVSNIGQDTCIVASRQQLSQKLKSLLYTSNQNNVTNESKTIFDRKIKQKNTLSAKQSFLSESLNCYEGQCRAFLKVQDGCDGYCTYCIIPKVRPVIYSRPLDDIVKEAQQLIYAGHREIVLTGIFLGAYGHSTVRRKKWTENSSDFIEMIRQVAQIPHLKRLRLSSLEPADVTDELIELMACSDVIVPHLHLPLQSGSPDILRKMARQYNLDDFIAVADKLKTALNTPAITTDIIVGFPGESDADFQQSIDIARRVGFAKIHVFSFSPVENTVAAGMPGQVDKRTITLRSKILRKLDRKLQLDFRKQFVNQPVTVIIENDKPPQGRTERYFMVELRGLENPQKGSFVNAVLNEDPRFAGYLSSTDQSREVHSF